MGAYLIETGRSYQNPIDSHDYNRTYTAADSPHIGNLVTSGSDGEMSVDKNATGGTYTITTGGGAGYAGNDDRYGGIGGVGSGGDINLHGDAGASEGNDGSNNPNPPASPSGLIRCTLSVNKKPLFGVSWPPV